MQQIELCEYLPPCDALYHLGANGMLYRVRDCTMRDGSLIAATPPASWATSHVFEPKAGHRRLYRFGAGESREPREQLLRVQLERAEYLPSEPPHSLSEDPW